MSIEAALRGVQVVEVATYLPGPACTRLLASLGARVTKVVRPGGDPLRRLSPLHAAYAALNAGKGEVELDLKRPEDAETFRTLARQADVVVDGMRPGALDRLGVGAAALQALNPRLIYCALSGYGLSGPLSHLAGHDLNFVALSGLLATTTVGDEPALPGTQLADLVSGLTAATAILAALLARGDGPGCRIDAPMLGATRWLMTPWYAVACAGEQAGGLTGRAACYRAYRTADGRHLAVAALEPHFWARFCEALGRPDLIPRHQDADQQALADEIAALIARRRLEDWLPVFVDLDACVTPALTLEEASRDWDGDAGLPCSFYL
ncbi:MAG: CoA transferase [Chloroflexaceae bacterium]